MLNKSDLIKKLEKDIKETENKIEYKNLYNVRNFIIRGLLKTGIAVDYALPYILSGIIIFNVLEAKNKTPFIVDQIPVKASVETMITSTGIESTVTSFDYKYDIKALQYSSGWKENESGIYERTITDYDIGLFTDLSNKQEIFSQTKSELDNKYNIENCVTVKKGMLDEEDLLYKDEMIIIKESYIDNENVKIKTETLVDNILSTSASVIGCYLIGIMYNDINKLYLKKSLKNTLNNIQSKYKKITLGDLNNLKRILELNKENLELLTNNNSNKFDSENIPQLRKMKGSRKNEK